MVRICRPPGKHVLRIVNVFPDRNNTYICRDGEMQQPSTSRSIFCVFGSFASSLSRHLAYRAVVANMGLRPPLFVLKRHSRGTLWYDHSAV